MASEELERKHPKRSDGSADGLDTVDSWWRLYRRDFTEDAAVIDRWYDSYRKDFMPKYSGRVHLGIKPAVEKRVRETLFRDLPLVGRGKVTNDKCGKWRGWFGCLQHEKHDGDVIYASPYFNYCDRPSSPICYRDGWAAREGSAIGFRLLEASKMFGLPTEHLVASLPKSDYDLTFKEAKRRCIEILFARGVTGGVLIPHGNRIDRVTWFESYSPHFHVLSFVGGGYGRCRSCSHNPELTSDNYWDDFCYRCDGFEALIRREYEKDGWIVKVASALEERKTIGGTAFYQLHHASYDPFKRRSRVAVYFGSCGYNNLKAKVAKPKLLCPLCGATCGFIEHTGSKNLIVDRRSLDFVKKRYEDYLENGEVAWIVRESKPSEVE